MLWYYVVTSSDLFVYESLCFDINSFIIIILYYTCDYPPKLNVISQSMHSTYQLEM